MIRLTHAVLDKEGNKANTQTMSSRAFSTYKDIMLPELSITRFYKIKGQ